MRNAGLLRRTRKDLAGVGERSAEPSRGGAASQGCSFDLILGRAEQTSFLKSLTAFRGIWYTLPSRVTRFTPQASGRAMSPKWHRKRASMRGRVPVTASQTVENLTLALPNTTRFRISSITVLLAVGFLLSACAGAFPSEKEALVPAAELAAERDKRQALGKQRAELQRELKDQTVAHELLEENVARLYLLLLEKDAHIKRLGEQLEEGILEVVRAKAKLRSLGSKAEAASNLAEAEIALKALKARTTERDEDQTYIKADQLTKMSALEFKKGNYGGALYLTSQVKSLIKGARERSMNQEMSSMVGGEVPFALPLPLQLLSKSNVMEGPGPHFKVLYSLEKGTALIGHAYKGQWVRVKSEDGRGGWVFYKLVGSD